MLTEYQLSLWFVCTFHKFMLWFVFPCVFCSVWSSLEFNRLLWMFTSQMVIQDPYDPPFPHSVSHSSLSASKWSDLWFRLNHQITRWEKRTTAPFPAAALTWLEPDSLYPPAFFLPGAVAGKIELASERHEEALEWTAALREQDEAKPISQAWMERAACSVSLEMDWPLFQSAVAVPWAEF